MKEPELLSVILPVYDRVAALKTCLECLSRQTLEKRHWELILVSDGGPRNIEACSRAFELLLPLRFFRQENSGPARARNFAMSKAKGKHFLFLNDDIRFDVDYLKQYHEFLSQHPDHAVTGNTRWAEELIHDDFSFWVSQQDHVFYNVNDRMNASWEFWHTLNASVPRRFFDEGELFDETYPDPAFEDTEYIYRLQKKHDLKIAFLADAIVEHVHPFTFQEFCEKAQVRGTSAARFLASYPEKFERILAVNSDDEARALIERVSKAEKPETVMEKAAKGHAAFLTGYLEGQAALV